MRSIEKSTNAHLVAIILSGRGRTSPAAEAQGVVLVGSGPDGVADFVSRNTNAVDILRAARGSGLAVDAAVTLAAALELGRRAVRPPSKLRRVEPSDVFEYFRPRIGGLPYEEFHMVTVNAALKVLGYHFVAKGGISALSILPRDIFLPAIQDRASSVILVHNHPGGNPELSEEDIALTKRTIQAGALLGIAVLDHLVITDHAFRSFRALVHSEDEQGT